MSTPAREVAADIVRSAVSMGVLTECMHTATQQGIGDVVLHLLSYTDPLAGAMIESMREAGLVNDEQLGRDKAWQQEHCLPGFTMMAMEARWAAKLLCELMPEGDAERMRRGITQAKDAGLVVVVVVAAERILGTMLDVACTCSQCTGQSPAQAERERRANRARGQGR